ncbi:MAG TPA: nucleotidyltransferase domain-containing protein [Kofleriaceae bacterium]|nr:nucleotidyltransferase domain-containing protein [Kofleriaceae bacterium]
MALRLGGLVDLDPESVPLPTGTEVTTRVDRVVEGELRKRGAAGRVARIDDDRVEVAFVDGKRGAYLRSEVAPKKLGELRYAHRRAAAWDELRPCVAIDAMVGSRAWGVASEGSDEDHRGVFVLPATWTTGLVDPPLDLISADGSTTYWEIGKAIRQALRADPNTLEMLFASPQIVDPIGEPLVAMRARFLSQEIYGSFGRYALSQLDRLEHNQRLAEHRATVLEWLHAEPQLTLDAAAGRLADAARVEATRNDGVMRARDYLKQLYRSLYDQGLIAANDWASLRTAARTRELGLPRDLRPKNAYNLVRLLDLAVRWLRGEPPDVRASDEIRPLLRAIKAGQLAMADVMAHARALTPALEAAREASPLPRYPDVARADRVLREARLEAARRWIAGESNAWGTNAAAPPEAKLDD